MLKNIRVNSMYPIDFTYSENLKTFLDYEPGEARAPEVRGIRASVDIIKGVPLMTIYNRADGTIPEIDQPFPRRNQFDKAHQNADGACDMALDPPFVVRIEKRPGGSFGETMNAVRTWLDHRHIEPASFMSVANALSGVGFEIGFSRKDEAYLFEEAFRA
jgi:hypothetical protein